MERSHILTIELEDYFQGAAFHNVIDRRQWPRFEMRLEKSTLTALDALDRFGAKATFFVTRFVAERRPDVIREVVRRGHEIASSGSSKQSFRQFKPAEFREDLRRSRGALEDASGKKVIGYRVADLRLSPRDLWALEILAGEGYRYDSSVSPSLRSFYSEPWRRFPHRMQLEGREFWEFPLPAVSLMGIHIPIAGGNYFRQFPEGWVKTAVDRWTQTYSSPFVMYFRVWDLDPEQPRITAAPMLSRIRHYRNPGKMARLLEHFLSKFRYQGIGEYLRVKTETAALRASYASPAASLLQTETACPPEAVSVVIPCFNEDSVMPYLANTLRGLRVELGTSYSLRYILIDDGSSDDTWNALQTTFGSWDGVRLVRHERNRGVAAAILSGIGAAETDIVCSMDCDCTYDPHELRHMIPLLAAGVDLVTASPYHPRGKVLHVPRWRLALSKSASFLYRRVLRTKLHTYTSCFRVYRRAAVAGLEVRHGGFLGVAEMIGALDERGCQMKEHPATLEVRMLGRSKMKVARTTMGHLLLLARLARERLIAHGRERPGEKKSSPEPLQFVAKEIE